MSKFVGNNTKEQISKRVFQENKARQIFRKTNISYPMILTRTFASQGVKKCSFFGKFSALFSWNTSFKFRPFALSPTYCSRIMPDFSIRALWKTEKEDWKIVWFQKVGGIAEWKSLRKLALHKKWSFPLRISSVNVTKSVLENFISCSWRFATL